MNPEPTIFGLSVGNAVTVGAVLISVGYNYATLHFLKEKFVEFKQDMDDERDKILKRLEVDEARLMSIEINLARLGRPSKEM